MFLTHPLTQAEARGSASPQVSNGWPGSVHDHRPDGCVYGSIAGYLQILPVLLPELATLLAVVGQSSKIKITVLGIRDGVDIKLFSHPTYLER